MSRSEDREKIESQLNEKHVLRARDAIAKTLCECHFTDGFCIAHKNPECRCNKLAASCINAMLTRGVHPVWEYDPENGSGI